MPTAIVHHPVFEKHDTGPGHPEQPARYTTVMDALRSDSELWANVVEVEAEEARHSFPPRERLEQQRVFA